MAPTPGGNPYTITAIFFWGAGFFLRETHRLMRPERRFTRSGTCFICNFCVFIIEVLCLFSCSAVVFWLVYEGEGGEGRVMCMEFEREMGRGWKERGLGGGKAG